MKIAKVGYGTKNPNIGKTQGGYQYLVNDNVRTKDVIQVISTSRAGNKFPTSATALSLYKENSVKGMAEKQRMQEKDIDITQTYSGKQLGATGSIRKLAEPIGDNKRQSQYVLSTRAGLVEKTIQQQPQASFSKNAMLTYTKYKNTITKII